MGGTLGLVKLCQQRISLSSLGARIWGGPSVSGLAVRLPGGHWGEKRGLSQEVTIPLATHKDRHFCRA